MNRHAPLAAIVGLVLLAGCVRPGAPPPVPAPAPQPLPAPAPAPPAGDWRDRALTKGDWSYRKSGTGSTASFGGATPVFAITCDAATRQIGIARTGIAAPGGMLTLRATEGVASYPLVAHAGAVAALLQPRDAQLDRIAFSRGRFLVQTTGTDDLVIPSWAELSRVIEDCRI